MLNLGKLGRLGRTRLRVAMVWGDRIVQDEVFRPPDVVRVGERPDRCDFVVSDRRLPPVFELLRPVPGGFVLRVTEAVIGQVFVGGQQLDLERLHAAGVGGTVVGEVPLARGDHGVVSVGPVAFVFHFVGDGHAMPALSLARSFDRAMARRRQRTGRDRLRLRRQGRERQARPLRHQAGPSLAVPQAQGRRRLRDPVPVRLFHGALKTQRSAGPFAQPDQPRRYR